MQLIFEFDQFEDLWGTLSPRFFLNLRGLRDQYKYALVFLVLTRGRLQRTHDEPRAVESFWELFSGHTYGIGMYSQRDASAMLDRLDSRRGTALGASLREDAFRLSGCHPALLRAVYWALCDTGDARMDVDDLLQLPAIAEECEKIWYDLLADEQQAVRIFALGYALQATDPELAEELHLKQLIDGDVPTLFSPIFAAYARKRSDDVVSGVVVDVRLRQIWVDGQPSRIRSLHLNSHC